MRCAAFSTASDRSRPVELGWEPAETFETGLEKTVRWYLDNQAWVDDVVSSVESKREAGSYEWQA